eukprot:g1158.t1
MEVSVPITTRYAGACALVYVALSFRVINLRMKKNISVGDKQDSTLFYAIRGHGNFQEYVPITLLLLALAEIQKLLSPQYLHILAASLFVGRLLHASCFVFKAPRLLRIIGTASTLTNLIVLGVVLVKASM